MNISQINYILAVDRLGSFGKAADSCFVTQSTLSAMVAKFERQIDIKIFDRKSKPIQATHEGRIIINQLKNIAKEVKYLDEVVQSLKGILSGSIVIAGIPTVAPYLFPLILDTFTSKYPEITFTIHEATTHKIIEGILKREIDIGIVSTPLDHKNIVEYPLYEEPFLIYDKTGNKTKKTKKVINISDINFDKLWLLEEGHCMRNQVENICELRQKKLINGNLIYKSGTIETLKKLVNHNKGITLLPSLSLLDFQAEDKAFLKKFARPIPVREIGLIVHENFVKKVILQELSKTIQKKIKPLLGKSSKSKKIIKPF